MMIDSLAKEPLGRSFVICAAPNFYLCFVSGGFYWNNTGFVSTAHLKIIPIRDCLIYENCKVVFPGVGIILFSE